MSAIAAAVVETTYVVRNKFEEELREIMASGGKRRRVQVKVELKEESSEGEEGEAYPSPAPSVLAGKKGGKIPQVVKGEK